MNRNAVIGTRMHLPQCFTVTVIAHADGPTPIEDRPAFLDSIAVATEECVGIKPASVHYQGAPYVSFGEGRPTDRWWYKGDTSTGTFERCSLPNLPGLNIAVHSEFFSRSMSQRLK